MQRLIAYRYGFIPLILTLALFAGVASAQTQDASPDKTSESPSRADIIKKASTLSKQAKSAYQKKDFVNAARLFEEVTMLVDRAPSMYFLLAMSRLQIGENEKALTALETSGKEGMIKAERLDNPIFDSIREEPRFRAVKDMVKESDRRVARGLEARPVEVEGVKTIEGDPALGFAWRLRISPEATSDSPQRLIIWLHPAGNSMNPFIERMSPYFIKEGFALMVVAAKSWRFWTQEDIRRLVQHTLPDVVKEEGVDGEKPILLGYSAGGQAALQMWTEKPEAYGGLILDAAYPSDMQHWRKTGKHILQPVPGDGKNVTPLFVLVGSENPGAAMWKEAEAKWKARVDLTVLYVEGYGHNWLLGNEQFEALKAWLKAIKKK
jgi:predicted esterase